MEGTPLLDVLRGLILEPDAQADFSADPSGYMQRYGYDEVDAEHMSEAIGLVADTLPPDVAQAVSTATGDEAVADGDPLGLLGRLAELDIETPPAELATDGEGAATDPGDMEGPVDLDPFDDDLGAAGEEHDALDLGGGERGDASFGDDLDDDALAAFGDDPDGDDPDDGDAAGEEAAGADGEAVGSALGDAAAGFGEGSAPEDDEVRAESGDDGGSDPTGVEGGFDLGLDDDLGALPGFDAGEPAYGTDGYGDPADADLDGLDDAGGAGDAEDGGPDAFGSGDDIGLF